MPAIGAEGRNPHAFCVPPKNGQLSAILGAEHPRVRVYAVDPGDMRTQMQQDAFPGEDISDRPLPEESVPGLLERFNLRFPGEFLAGGWSG